MFIEVMYADFTRQRVDFDELALLPKTEVLFIVLSTEWGNRRALVNRLWSRHNRDPFPWAGDDMYAIGIIGDRFFTKQWANEDEYLLTRSLKNPLSLEYERTAQPIWTFPKDATVYIFTGGWVPPDQWEVALKIFETEMF